MRYHRSDLDADYVSTKILVLTEAHRLMRLVRRLLYMWSIGTVSYLLFSAFFKAFKDFNL